MNAGHPFREDGRHIVQRCGDPVEEEVLDHAVRRVQEGRPRARVAKLALLDFVLLTRRLSAKVYTSPYGQWVRLFTAVGEIDVVPDAHTAIGTFELVESLR